MIAADRTLVRGSKVPVFCALFAACGVRGGVGKERVLVLKKIGRVPSKERQE